MTKKQRRPNRRIPVKHIYFGETDGFHEYLNMRDANIGFSEVFCDPPLLEFAKFTNSSASAFIVGSKGEGKTALLSLIKEKIKKEHSDSKVVQFIRYDWEFNQEKRKSVSRALGFKFAEKRPEEEGLAQFEQEFRTAWRWFLHKIFFDSLQADDFKDFVKNSALASKYVKLFKGIDGSEDRSFLSWFPKLTNGNVTLKGDMAFFAAELNANFEPNQEAQASMTAILDVLDEIIFSLGGLPKDITIIIDEIELRFDEIYDWERDLRYIHDLIYVSSIYIDKFRENDVRIQFLVALRESVILAVEKKCDARVKRALETYSTPIRWYETGELRHCAFAGILDKKIAASEKSHYKGNYQPPSDRWRWLKYFPEEMGSGESFLSWLFQKTFWRPRDLVRLFKVLKENTPPSQQDKPTFEQSLFSDYVLGLYSTEQWREMSEDLNTFFPPDVVRTITSALRELDTSFTYDELISALRGAFDEDTIEDSKNSVEAASFLFELGVIGNSERTGGNQVEIWSFQRNDKLDPTKRLRLHDVMQMALSKGD